MIRFVCVYIHSIMTQALEASIDIWVHLSFYNQDAHIIQTPIYYESD